MANLTEHVIINKWDNDINDAITAVGGNTEGAGGFPDYAKIIREQLVAKGIGPEPEAGKEFILEGDSCVIEADDNGCDYYNTEYAIGIKTGLIPGTLYLRLCTAVKDIEPVYIDLTRVCGEGGEVDIEKVIEEVLKSTEFISLQDNINNVQNQITQLQETKIEKDEVTIIINEAISDLGNNEGIDVDELNWD